MRRFAFRSKRLKTDISKLFSLLNEIKAFDIIYLISYNLIALSATNKFNFYFAAMAQQVEHILGKDEVTGSTPVSSSITLGNFREFFVFNFLHRYAENTRKQHIHKRDRKNGKNS